MFKFIFFIFFFFILLVLLMGFSVLRTFKNILFGSGEKKGKQRKQTKKNSSSGQRSSGNRSYDSSSPAKKKIFTKDEGEYVDYEEVK